jgi:thiamine pyrophosphate-dependent acetolactate synthase large subunit-like protein
MSDTTIAGHRTVTATGGELLARLLAAAGVREVFGVPAGKLSAFLKAVGSDDRLRHVGVRHEASAAWAAAAVFQATGRLAVAYGESGPGSHNLVGGLGSAWANGLALVVITADPPPALSDPNVGLTMDADNRALFGACTKERLVVRDAARLPELVHRAVRTALAGRPGPVVLSVSADVLGQAAELPEALLDAAPEHVRATGRAHADPAGVARAAELLATARRPLVLAGGGVVLADAAAALRRVADRLGAAATTTLMGMGVVPTTSPRFFGHGGVTGGEAVVRALREADAVLAVGCRFSGWTFDGPAPAAPGWPGQELVHVDVDPLVIGARRPVSVGLAGDARAVLEQLDAALHGHAADVDTAWIDGLVAEGRAHRAALTADRDARPMHPGVLADAVGRALPDDALVVFDGGHTTFWSTDLTPAHEPRTRFHDPGMSHLGFGTAAALGLAVAVPDRPVVVITGDGALGFTLPELDALRREGLPVVHVVHDNQQWGVIALGQSRHGFELGTSLDGTDLVAIATAFGAHAERVEQVDDVAPALARALASGRPAVLDCRVQFVGHPGMRRFAAAGRPLPEAGA